MANDSHDNLETIGANSTRLGAVLAGTGLLALALVPLGQVVLAVGIAGGVMAAAVAAVAIATGNWGAFRLAGVTLVLGLIGLIGLPFGIWFAVAAVWLAGLVFPRMAPSERWLPRGRSSPLMWWLTGMIVVVAGAGLATWALVTPNPARATTGLLVQVGRDLPWWAVALFVAIFVPVNAVTEEIAYRGIALESASVFLSAAPAVVAQAVAFGTLHVAGFPAGVVGIALTAGYGLILGIMRQISGGLRFPVIAHMAADATIAVLVILLLV